MLHLMLFRHAKADQPANVVDHDRPLSILGHQQASVMGTYIRARQLEPEHVAISSARRTQETWETARDARNLRCTVSPEPRIYEASVENLLEVISKQDAAHQRLMLIGHNPGMERLTTWLTGSVDAVALRSWQQGFTVGSLAVIALPTTSWSALQPQTGRLERFETPETAIIAGVTDPG